MPKKNKLNYRRVYADLKNLGFKKAKNAAGFKHVASVRRIARDGPYSNTTVDKLILLADAAGADISTWWVSEKYLWRQAHTEGPTASGHRRILEEQAACKDVVAVSTCPRTYMQPRRLFLATRDWEMRLDKIPPAVRRRRLSEPKGDFDKLFGMFSKLDDWRYRIVGHRSIFLDSIAAAWKTRKQDILEFLRRMKAEQKCGVIALADDSKLDKVFDKLHGMIELHPIKAVTVTDRKVFAWTTSGVMECEDAAKVRRIGDHIRTKALPLAKGFDGRGTRGEMMKKAYQATKDDIIKMLGKKLSREDLIQIEREPQQA